VAKLRDLVGNARRKPEMNQIEMHPYLQQPGMIAFCRPNGVFLTAYSPLGSSDRPAHLKAADEPVLLEDPVVRNIAARHSATPAQVLIRWALHRKTAVIPKSVNPARLKENLAAENVILTPEDLRELADLDLRRRYVTGAFWVLEGGPYTLANLWDE
jgi:alcohol dehydrogenase (NADP+)